MEKEPETPQPSPWQIVKGVAAAIILILIVIYFFSLLGAVAPKNYTTEEDLLVPTRVR